MSSATYSPPTAEELWAALEAAWSRPDQERHRAPVDNLDQAIGALARAVDELWEDLRPAEVGHLDAYQRDAFVRIRPKIKDVIFGELIDAGTKFAKAHPAAPRAEPQTELDELLKVDLPPASEAE